MSPLNEEQPSSKPSLLGARHSSAADTPENHRVLAHLEGRKPPSSSPQKHLGKVFLAALLLIGGGLYAWRTPAPIPSHEPSSSANSAVTASALPAAPTQTPAETAPQPARILQDSTPTQQSTESTQTSSHAAPDPLQFASLASTPSPTAPTASKKADTTASAKPHPAPTKTGQSRANPVKTLPSSDTSKAPAKRAVANPKAPSRQAEKVDPDAELLATLLQRRDPQTPGQRK